MHEEVSKFPLESTQDTSKTGSLVPAIEREQNGSLIPHKVNSFLLSEQI